MAGAIKSGLWRGGVLGAVALLVACGPTPSELQWSDASHQCAYGDRYACDALPALSYQARAERQQQDTNAAVAIGVLALGGLAIAATADHNHWDDGWRRRGHRRW